MTIREAVVERDAATLAALGAAYRERENRRHAERMAWRQRHLPHGRPTRGVRWAADDSRYDVIECPCGENLHL